VKVGESKRPVASAFRETDASVAFLTTLSVSQAGSDFYTLTAHGAHRKEDVLQRIKFTQILVIALGTG